MRIAYTFRLGLALMAALVLVPAVVVAQTDSLIAVGVGGSAVDQDGRTTVAWSFPVFRLPRPEGISFDWDVGSVSTSQLHRWQYLFGPAYDLRIGRTEIVAGVVGGPSVNRSLILGLKARNSWALEPRVTLWLDVNEWLGVKVSALYVYTRADAVSTSAGSAARFEDRHVSVQTGIVIKVYPW